MKTKEELAREYADSIKCDKNNAATDFSAGYDAGVKACIEALEREYKKTLDPTAKGWEMWLREMFGVK